MKTTIMGFFLTFLLFTPTEAGAGEVTDIATSAQDIHPLSVGATVPSLTLQSIDGKAFDLDMAIKKQPTILIFYRGGWCPYCNRQLGQLQTIESELQNLGFQILAISTDRPEKLATPAGLRRLSRSGRASCSVCPASRWFCRRPRR